ncbi:MAG: SPW repeat protein [Alphaproteobacteria bacterium]|nr:SPW repeat protein [Alphaproteobacteria bacterium]
MAGVKVFGVHRSWEDWLTMALGAVTAASPWFAGAGEPWIVAWNTVLIGAMVILLGVAEFYYLELWEEVAQILCGVWLIASPFNIGYGGALRAWHLALGAVVIVVAIVELVQDWPLTDEQRLHHGK